MGRINTDKERMGYELVKEPTSIFTIQMQKNQDG